MHMYSYSEDYSEDGSAGKNKTLTVAAGFTGVSSPSSHFFTSISNLQDTGRGVASFLTSL